MSELPSPPAPAASVGGLHEPSAPPLDEDGPPDYRSSVTTITSSATALNGGSGAQQERYYTIRNNRRLKRSACWVYFGLPFRPSVLLQFLYCQIGALILLVFQLVWIVLSLVLTLVSVIIPPAAMLMVFLTTASWRFLAVMELKTLQWMYAHSTASFRASYHQQSHRRIEYPPISLHVYIASPRPGFLERSWARAKRNMEDGFTWVALLYLPLIKLPLTLTVMAIQAAMLLGSLALMFHWVLVLLCKDQCYGWFMTRPNASMYRWLLEPGAGPLITIPFGMVLYHLTFMFVDASIRVMHRVAFALFLDELD